MYAVVKLTRREIEGRLSRLVPDWTRSPREEGGLLGLLAGGGPLKGVRLCPTAPHEARVIVAVLVDSLGGLTDCVLDLRAPCPKLIP